MFEEMTNAYVLSEKKTTFNNNPLDFIVCTDCSQQELYKMTLNTPPTGHKWVTSDCMFMCRRLSSKNKCTAKSSNLFLSATVMTLVTLVTVSIDDFLQQQSNAKK